VRHYKIELNSPARLEEGWDGGKMLKSLLITLFVKSLIKLTDMKDKHSVSYYLTQAVLKLLFSKGFSPSHFFQKLLQYE
jgi:hypothetical protein